MKGMGFSRLVGFCSVGHGAGVLVVVALVLVAGGAMTHAEEQGKLNVLFIAVDDLRPEIGCYGAARAKTPNLDRLAQRGMIFERAYCQQAVCSPSRTSLLTGLRPDSTKVYDLETHFRDTVGRNLVTLPQHFKNHGYTTLGMGKIYHGGLNDELSWSEPWTSPKAPTYQRLENQGIVQRRREKARADGKRGRALNRAARGPAVESGDVADNAYHDGALADMAIESMRRVKDEPFFLAVGFIRPHLPFVAPQKYWDLYQRDAIELAENRRPPENAPPFGLTDWGELRQYEGVPRRGALSDDQARELIHGYLAAVSYLDAQVGRVLDELENLGLQDKTIVVLWGDHGWKLGEHGAWCKHTNYELDTRVPLFFSAPGVKARGQKTRALVEFVDIYPTLCETAGLTLPDHLEGTSFAPLLDDPTRAWKSAAISQYPRTHDGRRLMGYAMRTDRYRYVEWQDRQSGATVAQELYDHQSEAAENANLAADPKSAQLLADLSAQLQAGWKAARPKE